MREIKFRAWNVAKGSWCKFLDLPFDASEPYEILDITPKKDTIIEQYTGLKDKNGLEIYEGDIVKIKVEETDFGIYEIYWDDELCEFGYKYSNEPFNAQFYMDREIVGNIHVNPELLK